MIFVVCAAIIIAALSIISFYTGGSASPVSGAVSTVISPFTRTFTWAANGIEKIIAYVTEFDNLKLENEDLKQKVIDMEELTRDAEHYKEENEKLRSLLDIQQENEKFTLQMCDIISRSDRDWSRCFTIDKGSSSDIEVGDCVIVSEGFVGYVTEVGPNWSNVITVIDSGMSVGARITRTSESMICEGDFSLMPDGLLNLSYMRLESSVYSGDTVTTSGIGDNFPEGIIIGEVKEVSIDSTGNAKSAVVSPSVDVDSLTVVFVITDFVSEN